MMNWRVCEESGHGPNLRYYPGLCLEVLSKNTRNLSQDSQSLGRELDPGPPEYNAGVLTTRPRHSVKYSD
jgi:hypothetical protein